MPAELSLVLSSETQTWLAILGDLHHKEDVYTHFHSYGQDINFWLSTEHQAQYLEQHHPELLPPREPNGTPPSKRRLAQVFEVQYQINLAFRHKYVRHLPSSSRPDNGTASV